MGLTPDGARELGVLGGYLDNARIQVGRQVAADPIALIRSGLSAAQIQATGGSQTSRNLSKREAQASFLRI